VQKFIPTVLLVFCIPTVLYSQNQNTKTTDKGVKIGNTIWATRNVDAPGTFAEAPESAGMFYQWNRNIGWSTTDPVINSRWRYYMG
jgi:hypothetical protein